MPGANALSTVEWHSAQVVPTRVSRSTPLTVSTVPLSPTTALSFSRATVVAGLRRSTLPFWMPATTAAGSASASTLSPTDSAVTGSTAAAMTSCMRSVSVHSASSPKVSKRKICLPCACRSACAWLSSSESPPQAASVAASVAEKSSKASP